MFCFALIFYEYESENLDFNLSLSTNKITG